MNIAYHRDIENVKRNWTIDDSTNVIYWYTDTAGNRIGKKFTGAEFTRKLNE